VFRFAIGSLTFSDSTTLTVPTEGVVVLVGPNNAGKSAALREIARHLQGPSPTQPPLPRVVVGETLSTDGTVDELETWLTAHAFRMDRADGRYFQRPRANVRWDILRAEWDAKVALRPNLAAFMVFHAAADGRLGLIGDSAPHDPLNQAPDQPMQVLFAKPELQARLAAIAREAFGQPVTLAQIWGSNLRLHLGDIEEFPSIPPTASYIKAISQLPLLAEQRDGVRSFMGLMLALTTAQYPVVLADEPEAFLHPPQARLLGRKLATEAPSHTQVFVATHDSDVLQGLLDAEHVAVTVVRLVRDGALNRASVLEAPRLRELWRDPLLRYSNVLEGLFHRGVVVTESDGDSRFYAAVLNVVRDNAGLQPHDLLFTQSGGKQRLPTILRALTAVGVPVSVVVDFDVFQTLDLLAELVALLGGDWASCEVDARVVATSIENGGSAPSMTVVREELARVLDGVHGATLTPEAAKRIRAVTRVDDAWRRAKQGGESIVAQGEPSQRLQAVLATLANLGIFVVPVGELERWFPELADHGPQWVSTALGERKHEDVTSPVAHFMTTVASHFG
jgi:energy-coupling factor transporter ATP-binding protein EcfA2